MGVRRYFRSIFIIPILFSVALSSNGQTTAIDYLRYAVEATESGDYTGAIVLCDHSISLDGNNELAFYHRAYNRLMVGDIHGAIEDTSKSIELNDRIADTFLLRAEAKLKLGERISAIADYNRARRLDGSITIAHFAQNLVKVIF
jgi:tetratricopeptide (TPR) repeat protein